MSEDKNDDFELVTGVPAGADLTPIAKAVNPAEEARNKQEAENFMKLLGQVDVNKDVRHHQPTSNQQVPITDDPTVVQPNKDAMKEILERFHESAGYNVEQGLTSPEMGSQLKRMVLNEDNSNKEWQIRLNESESRDTYDIVNMSANKSFFSNVYLQETAKIICNLLEKGHAVNSKKITSALYYDQTYKKHYNDAMNCKRLHEKAMKIQNSTKINLYADKFDVAREKALAAKKSLKKYL